jgi:hypothetical protein
MQKFSIKFVALLLLIIPLSFIACEKQELTNPIRPKVGKPADVSKFVKKSFKVTTNSVFYKIFANSEQSKIDYARFGNIDLETMKVDNFLLKGKEFFCLSASLKKAKNHGARENTSDLEDFVAVSVFIDTLNPSSTLVLINTYKEFSKVNDTPYNTEHVIYSYDSKIVLGAEIFGKDSVNYYQQDNEFYSQNSELFNQRPSVKKCYVNLFKYCAEIDACNIACTIPGLHCRGLFLFECFVDSVVLYWLFP